MGLTFSAQADDYITLASTTSTQNSGLFDSILPKFEEATGIEVRVVAVGTGQAFELARRGDADSLLVHDTAGEKRFVENGFATERADVMYNDFVLIGPKDDPAKIRKAESAAEAFSAIAEAEAPFAREAMTAAPTGPSSGFGETPAWNRAAAGTGNWVAAWVRP